MKKIISLIFSIVFIAQSNAQLSSVGFSDPDLSRFKTSKTYFVKTGDSEFDEAMIEAMKTSWKITPFDVINGNQLEKMIPDKTSSFILPVTIVTDNGQSYHYVALLDGGKKRITKYSYNDMIAYGVINHFAGEDKNTDCAFRIRNIIEGMIGAIKTVEENSIKGGSFAVVSGLKKVYNKKATLIPKRTLLFCPEYCGKKLDETAIKKLYPYNFEICDKAKLESVIKTKDSKYYYFQPAITLNKCMFVIDPATGEVVYFDYQIQGLSITEGNIEDMVKTIRTGK